MITDDRNFLEEAIAIVKGESLLRPEPEHLEALNDSRRYWRNAALQHKPIVVEDEPKAARRVS